MNEEDPSYLIVAPVVPGLPRQDGDKIVPGDCGHMVLISAEAVAFLASTDDPPKKICLYCSPMYSSLQEEAPVLRVMPGSREAVVAVMGEEEGNKQIEQTDAMLRKLLGAVDDPETP